MSRPKITFLYTVGGPEIYYKNLEKSLRSLERIKQDYNVVILDSDGKYRSTQDNVKSIHFPIPHPIRHWYWFMRYQGHSFIETDYCLYLDIDTVITNDTVDHLIDIAKHDFVSTQHFWVPTVVDYYHKAGVADKWFQKFYQKNANYVASGAFFFQPGVHAHIFEKVMERFYEIYGDNPEVFEGCTDEFVLNSVLQDENVLMISGAFNHCCEHPCMPLDIDSKGRIIGKNPWEQSMELVTALHCDTSRRDPRKNYHSELQKQIGKAFYLD
jgi:lipopolysaccharide biosynthesis glycosyltransferase